MTNWLIPANPSFYDFARSFEDYGFIDWKQGNGQYRVNDLVYIYSSSPVQRLQYKCSVEKVNLTDKEIRDDREYWYNLSDYFDSLNGKFIRLVLLGKVDHPSLGFDQLKKNGLKSRLQGRERLKNSLLAYIDSIFEGSTESIVFPELIRASTEIYEGLKTTVTVNRYERSKEARDNCIAHHGHTCKVCNINFSKVFGQIGEGFIHVHHVVPLHTVGKEYKIDYENDLIPVCPNCHAMLHRRTVPYTVAELQELIAKYKQ